MSSHCQNSLLATMLVASVCGCQREARQDWSQPHEKAIPAASPDTIFPGSGQLPPLDPKAASYENNAHAIAKGQQLFAWMNCSGCHSHGGGGMGPALMDDKWLYGGRIDQIATSIMEGRPNGMPAWRGKITEQQMWQLAAYVRSLSGQVPKDAVSARADEISNTPPMTQIAAEPVHPAPAVQQ
jgi:cytochrome c oxidase cbb3-type subunit 3